MDGRSVCPDCGSDDAVSKSAAWDAMTSVPPKIAKELTRLKAIEKAAFGLRECSSDEDGEAIKIPLSVFDGIRDALQQ